MELERDTAKLLVQFNATSGDYNYHKWRQPSCCCRRCCCCCCNNNNGAATVNKIYARRHYKKGCQPVPHTQPQCIKNWKRMQTNDIIKTQERRETKTHGAQHKRIVKLTKLLASPKYAPREPENPSLWLIPPKSQSQSGNCLAACSSVPLLLQSVPHTHPHAHAVKSINKYCECWPQYAILSYWALWIMQLSNQLNQSKRYIQNLNSKILKYLSRQAIVIVIGRAWALGLIAARWG